MDYAVLEKIFGRAPDAVVRYSPPVVVATERHPITGNPDDRHISTSYVERSNLTMRMHMRRFTRLTNAYSKKVENLVAAVSLHFMWYNFARPHHTLTTKAKGIHTTPAMAAGVADHVWTVHEIADLISLYAK